MDNNLENVCAPCRALWTKLNVYAGSEGLCAICGEECTECEPLCKHCEDTGISVSVDSEGEITERKCVCRVEDAYDNYINI